MATGARVSENVSLAASRLVLQSKYLLRYSDTLLFSSPLSLLTSLTGTVSANVLIIIYYVYILTKKKKQNRAIVSSARARLIRERGLIPDLRLSRVYRCRSPRRDGSSVSLASGIFSLWFPPRILPSYLILPLPIANAKYLPTRSTDVHTSPSQTVSIAPRRIAFCSDISKLPKTSRSTTSP